MPSEQPEPDFDELADTFWRLGVMSSPAQLQGYLLGMLTSGFECSEAQWLELAATFIDPVEPPNEMDRETLLELLLAARRHLQDGGLELALLLPDDDVEISLRVDALSQWCRGYLAGFAFGGKQLMAERGKQAYSKDVTEALNDIATIAQASLGEGDEDEAEREKSFFDIVEYLRLSAINIHLDCTHAIDTDTTTKKPSDKTLQSTSALFAPATDKDKLH